MGLAGQQMYRQASALLAPFDGQAQDAGQGGAFQIYGAHLHDQFPHLATLVTSQILKILQLSRDALRILLRIAFRNLRASKVRTGIIGAIVAGGALLVVLGASLLDSIMQETKIRPSDDSYGVAKRGLGAFIKHLVETRATGKINQAAVVEMIAELDRKLSSQVDAILHHEQFQKLESAWRSLRFAIERINFREKWRGYLWQGRFASFVMDEPDLVAAARYVELNPVRAGLVTNPADWAWSSARAHLLGQDDCLVKVAPLLAIIPDWSASCAKCRTGRGTAAVAQARAARGVR